MTRNNTIGANSELDNRMKWTLRFLCVPDENGQPTPISGRTRIMKAMFLVQRNLRESFGKNAGFDFQPYKYGPFDQGVYSTLDSLKEQGLITVEKKNKVNNPSPENDEVYRATGPGMNEGERLLKEISDSERDLLQWVRFEQANKPLNSLLSYVYRKYEGMTDESEIKDQIL